MKQAATGGILSKNDLRPATLFKKTPKQVFSCEFSEIFKSTVFTERLWTTAPVPIPWYIAISNCSCSLALNKLLIF